MGARVLEKASFLKSSGTVDMPHVSIIVSCYNRAQTIKQCLSAIKASNYKDFELIIVDDASSDNTALLAQDYADKIITQRIHQGGPFTRWKGFEEAQGDIVINIDSDIVVDPALLGKIVQYFFDNPDVDALTGKLAKTTPCRGFFSQYKNLYMHYRFNSIKGDVTFLYGSLFAIRRNALSCINIEKEIAKIADDTVWGQQLAMAGKRISLVNELEAVHLKKHTFMSLIKNDFSIPFDWTGVYIYFKGWKETISTKGGFAHSSFTQIVGIAIALSISLTLLLSSLYKFNPALLTGMFLIWFLCNFSFFRFLQKEKGFIFLLKGIMFTFIDNIVMGVGIISGFTYHLLTALKTH